MTVLRGGDPVPLPASRKTRALLAYLVVTGRPHRRERLCNLLWDVVDDPRAALRWCLSKIRPVVDDPERSRIEANREAVAFRAEGAAVDLLEVQRLLGQGVDRTPLETLVRAAGAFLGEFLEGLELPEYHDFQAWLVAEREEARALQTRVLEALVSRLSSDPEAALPYHLTLVQVDPLNGPARANLVRTLRGAGRVREAEQHLKAGLQLEEEFGASSDGELIRMAEEFRAARSGTRAPGPETPSSRVPLPEIELPIPSGRLVGREAECRSLLEAVEAAADGRREQIVLLSGEPGVGKTRLLAELVQHVAARRGTVLQGAAFEAERSRPYGPWIDALRQLPAAWVGSTLGNDLAPLLPELPRDAGPEPSRERLFGAVVEVVAARAHSAPPVLLVLDDIQWCDDATVSLLHYVTRHSRHRPLVVGLAAREGELHDNERMLRFLRGLRRNKELIEIRLGPLEDAAIEALVRQVAPEASAAEVIVESGGNPLFALELARSLPAGGEEHAFPATLAEAVRDRVDPLPDPAVEALRWGALLVGTFAVDRLRELSLLPLEELVPALEVLTRHALLRETPGGMTASFAFAHELVREIVYNDLSSPRRLLMHGRVTRILQGKEDPDDVLAADLARHAVLAGEMEAAARACVAAGRRSLRLFANAEAYAFALRGARCAAELAERQRVELLLELASIRHSARRPERLDEEAREVEALAQRALELGSHGQACLGFHVVSSLRWEEGSWTDARTYTLKAEEISRSANSKERVLAMAETARCLTLLERDLGQAEALTLAARALSTQLGVDPPAIPLATGMLHLHRDEREPAATALQRARELARKENNHIGEFQALEPLVLLEMDRGDETAARRHHRELLRIGDRLREGSEGPFARALGAVLDYTGSEESEANLERELLALRETDAKHRLAVCLLRAAERDLKAGRPERSRERAEEALAAAETLGRPSETAHAHLLLARAAGALGDGEARARHLSGLAPEALSGVTTRVRRAAGVLWSEISGTTTGRRNGA